jgi:hypothetical protein
MRLSDLLDLDNWIAIGGTVLDFPWPGETENERAVVKLLLADRPDLAAHINRWGARVVELGAAHRSKGVLEVLSEAEVYAAWNHTKTGALS